tara:strand:- start:1412 stop:2575 length:1164 start_codon:yes stop_codon:yes gene_type:complete
MVKMIPYGRQFLDKEDIINVNNVLKSNYLTQGAYVPNFEKLLQLKVKVKYAVACNSATSALHIACLSLDLKKNDIVWTSPNSFIASANCAEYCGAKVDFVDINFNTGNIDIEFLKEKLETANKKNKLPKILIPVHFAGNPTNQEAIHKLSKKYGFKIIEDASHSLGSSNKSNKIGSCKFSDITVFSFHPVKSITSAEGGAATTKSYKLYKKMQSFRIHGVENKKNLYNKSYCAFTQTYLGYNYRLSDLHASLGISQLAKLDKFIKERNKIAKKYDKIFENTNIQKLETSKNCTSSYHLYVIRPIEYKKNYSNYKTIKFFRNINIGVNCHYFPIHLQPYYKKKGFKIGDFPNSEKHGRLSISIPIFVGLSNKLQIETAKKILKYFNEL